MIWELLNLALWPIGISNLVLFWASINRLESAKHFSNLQVKSMNNNKCFQTYFQICLLSMQVQYYLCNIFKQMSWKQLVRLLQLLDPLKLKCYTMLNIRFKRTHICSDTSCISSMTDFDQIWTITSLALYAALCTGPEWNHFVQKLIRSIYDKINLVFWA